MEGQGLACLYGGSGDGVGVGEALLGDSQPGEVTPLWRATAEGENGRVLWRPPGELVPRRLGSGRYLAAVIPGGGKGDPVPSLAG